MIMKKIYIVGSLNMDLVIETEKMPEAGMTVTGGGFMTNPEECEKLAEKEYQKQLSFAIFCGIIEYTDMRAEN